MQLYKHGTVLAWWDYFALCIRLVYLFDLEGCFVRCGSEDNADGLLEGKSKYSTTGMPKEPQRALSAGCCFGDADGVAEGKAAGLLEE